MIQRAFFGIVFLFTSAALAETTFKVPVFLDAGETSYPIEKLNAELKKQGERPIQEYYEIKSAKQGSDTIERLDAEVEKAIEKVGGKFKSMQFAHELFPNQYYDAKHFTCYTGRGDQVADFATDLTDAVYSDQLGLWGWKYHDKTVISDDDSETKSFLKKNGPDVWKKWRGNDDAVLILSHVGDEGTDVNVSIVKRCDD